MGDQKDLQGDQEIRRKRGEGFGKLRALAQTIPIFSFFSPDLLISL